MKNKIAPILLFAALGFSACGDTDDSSPDGRDDVAFADGKADGLFGECGEKTLLDLLNDSETTSSDLKDKGLHSRAANNIINRRNGADELAGTSDDLVFGDLTEVDAVPYVGRVAMNQLANLVADATCDDEPIVGNAEVIFSPQPYEDSHLAKVSSLIDGAQTSVDIAMYSFSDSRILNSIEQAVLRGVSVRMIFESGNKHNRSPEGSMSAKIEEAGVDVRYINKIMHHKYAIIDGPREVLSNGVTDEGIIATGSANWSNSAGTRYDENTVFVYGNSELNMKFQKEFNHLWANSRDFSFEASFEFFETDTIEDSMIPDDPNLDAVFTSANFKTSVSSRFGNTFSVIRGENEVADKIVELINQADESIYIASGHLRSRPVTEALLAKFESDPDLDVKVYLDGQEYVSSYTNRLEIEKREECLERAGESTSRRQDCFDKGYHYSYDLKEANVPMRFKYYSYRWHYSYAPQMHHKYLIIDGDQVISGSYNLSDNAEHNTMENMVIYDAAGFPDVVSAFNANFNSIWGTGDGLYDGLMEEVQSASRVPIVFDSMSIPWEQVNQLKRAISGACSEVNSNEFRRNPERHFYCDAD